jgi:hypothetical protein
MQGGCASHPTARPTPSASSADSERTRTRLCAVEGTVEVRTARRGHLEAGIRPAHTSCCAYADSQLTVAHLPCVACRRQCAVGGIDSPGHGMRVFPARCDAGASIRMRRVQGEGRSFSRLYRWGKIATPRATTRIVTTITNIRNGTSMRSRLSMLPCLLARRFPFRAVVPRARAARLPREYDGALKSQSAGAGRPASVLSDSGRSSCRAP